MIMKGDFFWHSQMFFLPLQLFHIILGTLLIFYCVQFCMCFFIESLSMVFTLFDVSKPLHNTTSLSLSLTFFQSCFHSSSPTWAFYISLLSSLPQRHPRHFSSITSWSSLPPTPLLFVFCWSCSLLFHLQFKR